eukprot:CAMPEP_0170088038 /NCGR_PEP_ID=MMETSP0019_2-20121128/22386_1 /TAXON_ID=98059 /ORGANISM="Dinobryon sp., Strain UTEXLB2267" /LENGTH=279 /DNA_ID=CAMNT_0010306029 /DNA_START=551 /DNA_END=1392 /DNA_ORIENTATION=-
MVPLYGFHRIRGQFEGADFGERFQDCRGSCDIRAAVVHGVLPVPCEHAGRQDGGLAQFGAGHVSVLFALRPGVVRIRRLRAASASVAGLSAAAVAEAAWQSIRQGTAGGKRSHEFLIAAAAPAAKPQQGVSVRATGKGRAGPGVLLPQRHQPTDSIRAGPGGVEGFSTDPAEEAPPPLSHQIHSKRTLFHGHSDELRRGVLQSDVFVEAPGAGEQGVSLGAWPGHRSLLWAGDEDDSEDDDDDEDAAEQGGVGQLLSLLSLGQPQKESTQKRVNIIDFS